MDRLDQLRSDLWARWTNAARTATVPPVGRGAHTAYSLVPRFDLSNWAAMPPAAGGRLRDAPTAGRNNYEYALDEQGRPVSSRLHHVVNGIEWRGTYRYAEDEIEFLDVCVNSALPSRYERVTIRDGCRASHQRLTLNAGGYFRQWRLLERESLIDAIRSSPLNYQLVVDSYAIAGGRLTSGESYVEGLGTPQMHFDLEFTYGDEGHLSRVVRRSADGTGQVLYARRSKSTIKSLSAELSSRIATKVVDTLAARAFESPLVAVELSYRSADRYLPFVVPIAENDDIATFPPLTPGLYERGFELAEEDVGPQLADFVARLEQPARFELGGAMLRESARIVTAAADSPFPRAADFIAYAIDWELEVDDLARILKACGASPPSLAAWKKRGWLP